MGLFNKTTTSKPKKLSDYFFDKILEETEFKIDNYELEHIFKEDPKFKKQFFKELHNEIINKAKFSLMQQIDNECSNPELYKQIKQSMVCARDNNVKDFVIDFNFEKTYLKDKLFNIKIIQKDHTTIQLLLKYDFTYHNFDQHIDIKTLFNHKLERTDFSKYKSLYDKNFIYQIKYNSHSLYVDESLIKKDDNLRNELKKTRSKIKSFDDLLDDLKDRWLITYPSHCIYNYLSDYPLFEQFDCNKIITILQSKLTQYLHQSLKDKVTIENSHNKLNITFNEIS